jgi:hypothetical protein
MQKDYNAMQKGAHTTDKGNSRDEDEVRDEARQIVLRKIKEADHKII